MVGNRTVVRYLHDGGPFESTITVTDLGACPSGGYELKLNFSDVTDYHRFRDAGRPIRALGWTVPWPCFSINTCEVVEEAVGIARCWEVNLAWPWRSWPARCEAVTEAEARATFERMFG